MEQINPRVFENREFVEYEEEDIQKLNRAEAAKFEDNPEIDRVMNAVEAELGGGGRWEEHWLTLDDSGSRVYARIYYSDDQALAVTADGNVVREIKYPKAEPARNKAH